jgi:hypothetical protein
MLRSTSLLRRMSFAGTTCDNERQALLFRLKALVIQ